MIEPKHSLPQLLERPPLAASWWVRLCCELVGPLIRWRLRRNSKRLEGRLLTLLEEVQRCATRAELERLLGPPEYGMVGHLFRRGAESPDCVESYAKDGCRVELWFRQGQLWSIVGSADYSAWQLADAGLAGTDLN